MKIEGIQGLRALAANLVLFFHVTGNERLQISLAGSSESPLFGTLFNQGFVGVDLFFPCQHTNLNRAQDQSVRLLLSSVSCVLYLFEMKMYRFVSLE